MLYTGHGGICLGDNISTTKQRGKVLERDMMEGREVGIHIILLTPGVGPLSSEDRAVCMEIVERAANEISDKLGWELRVKGDVKC